MTPSYTDHYESRELAKAKAREALVPKAQRQAAKTDRLSTLIHTPILRQIFRRGLPITAVFLSIISFGWPLLSKTEVSFTLSKDQVTESDGRVLMKDLRFTGVDKKDRMFTVNARQGEQEDPAAKRVRLTDIDAEIDLENDEALTLSARSGLYRLEEEQLSLTGDVTLSSNGGLDLSMGGVEIDLKSRTAQGEGNVIGRGSLGSIRSDRMAVDLLESTGLFTGRVRLHITPKAPNPSGETSP